MKKLKTNQEIQNEIEKIAEVVNRDFKGEEIDLIALNDSPKLFINDFIKHLKLKYKCKKEKRYGTFCRIKRRNRSI